MPTHLLRLQAATLKLNLADLVRYHRPRDVEQDWRKQQAWSWLHSGHDGELSFLTCCRALRVNPSDVQVEVAHALRMLDRPRRPRMVDAGPGGSSLVGCGLAELQAPHSAEDLHRRSRRNRKQRSARHCDLCGEDFLTAVEGKRYCSDCAPIAHEMRRTARRRRRREGAASVAAPSGSAFGAGAAAGSCAAGPA